MPGFEWRKFEQGCFLKWGYSGFGGLNDNANPDQGGCKLVGRPNLIITL